MSHEHPTEEHEKKESLNFIEQIIEEHNENGRFGGRVHTRFPPEPNGYLHIGHAKSICLNFGIAQKFGGKTNLRFDDTNPVTEDTEYVEAIKRDILWLGFEWEGEALYASDYFETLYQYAIQLIKQGDAYIDFSTAETMDKEKKAAVESVYRNRSIAENLADFEKMKNGEYEEGACVLRAKIDMQAPNWLLRDPILYRIKKAHHHRSGDKWCIYPMYDWAHGQSDSMEQITHSLCTLEFEPHRALYDWMIQKLGIYAPQQIEFSRLNLNYTITSKRKLKELVSLGLVSGWDDPRMPTITGMRRRGYTPASIRNFVEKAGISRREQQIDLSFLEFCVREDLNKVALRAMCVLDPIKVVITNYPADKVELLSIEDSHGDDLTLTRTVPFSREIYIEREDFMVDAPKKYFRLAPGKEVRLKGAYIIRCDEYLTDPETGEVTELHCSYYENSKSGEDTSGIKVKGTLHWVSIAHALEVEVRLYDRLFSHPEPDSEEADFKEFINPESLVLIEKAYAEPSLKDAQLGQNFQFLRLGYFCLDADSQEDRLVFNRTVNLKDSWSKSKE